MIGILHFGSFALYGIAGALLGVSFARQTRRLATIATVVAVVGLVLHGIALADYSSNWHQLPLIGLGPSLSTLAFLIALATVIAATLGHTSTIGLILVPLVALLTGIAGAVGLVPTDQPIPFRNGWFALHVVFALLGYAGLTIAFASGVMYLLQFRELKSKHFGAVFQFFPPLETLDRFGRRSVAIGFPFLTLAILLGWAWTSSFQGSVMPQATKLGWAVLSWFVLLVTLVARIGDGRKGERGAMASVIGFVVVVVAYLVIKAQTTGHGAFL